MSLEYGCQRYRQAACEVRAQNSFEIITKQLRNQTALAFTCLVEMNFCSMDLRGMPLTFLGELTLQLIEEGNDLYPPSEL